MTPKAERLLASAKANIKRGEAFYRQAAREIESAREEDFTLTWEAVAKKIGKSDRWCREIVAWATNPEGTAGRLPFSEPQGAVAKRHAKSSLRDAKPREIAEDYLADPQIRKNIQKAQDIAADKMVREAKKAERAALGGEVVDHLAMQQLLREAEGELFKARRALIRTLQILNTTAAESLDDSWREEFMRTFEDIAEKSDMGRGLLAGDITDELAKMLAEEGAR